MKAPSASKPTIDEEWAIKQLMMRAIREHPESNKRWNEIKDDAPFDRLILYNAKAAAAEAGFGPTQWHALPTNDQQAIARVLLDPAQFDMAIRTIKTGVPWTSGFEVIDRCFDLSVFVNLEGKWGQYPPPVAGSPATSEEMKQTILNYVGDAAKYDRTEREIVSSWFPPNCNPDLLNGFYLQLITERGCLSKNDSEQLQDFAVRRGILTPQLLITDATLDRNKRVQLSNPRMF